MSEESGFTGRRGRLLAALSSKTEDEKTPPDSGFVTGGQSGNVVQGRGRLFASRVTIGSQETASSVSSSDHIASDTTSRIAGRGRLLASLCAQSERLSIEESPSVIARDQREQEPQEPDEPQVPEREPYVQEELEVVRKSGVSGTKISAYTNYIKLNFEPNKGVFEYEVRFEPAIHSNQLRYKLLNQHQNIIGNARTFDGVVLYLPIRLSEVTTKLSGINPGDNSLVEITIIFKQKKKLGDCIVLFNLLFKRIMNTLKLINFGRKTFDPTEPKLIPQHKLEVWPGYVTAADEYEDGLMLCVDINHRVLCTTTVLEKITEAFLGSDRANYKANITRALIGSVILTRYNNKTYRIDDIDFESNPMSTFKTQSGNDITYVDYYKQHYEIEIRDLRQPLLIHRTKKRIQGFAEPQELTFCILPEISYLTGLTDQMRNDFKVMRDVATFTRITPNQRVQGLQKFCKRVNEEPRAAEILHNWGLRLESQPVRLEVRQLEEERVIFAKGKSFPTGRNADFAKYATTNELLDIKHISNWLIIHTKNDHKSAKAFMDCMRTNSKPMGINVNQPEVVVIDSDRTEAYIQTLRKHLNPKIQVVVIICPTSRDDRYAAIKKVCCAELPIPSQVINARTLSNDAKNRSIVQKIALQMNCKMGGTLWSIHIPFKDSMVVGIDTFHEIGKDSVSAVVASLNNTFTRWYSKATIQKKREELQHGLVTSLVGALNAYQTHNNDLPRRIIVFRDGVGDGQLKVTTEYELPQLRRACLQVKEDYTPEFTFVVVQKRINTRIFAGPNTNNLDNPSPGCILDHTVTRRYLYDFFLVPQSVRQGTVTPIHLIVVHDDNNFKPDILQRLTYKLCFLYYNWPGTVRVPACCQYAHKLATLIGKSVNRETAEQLADKLFYL